MHSNSKEIVRFIKINVVNWKKKLSRRNDLIRLINLWKYVTAQIKTVQNLKG